MRAVAFITGASSGIGRSVCRQLAACVPDIVVIASGRNHAELEALKAEFSAVIQPVAADVSTVAGREKIMAALSEYPRIDYVVHAAATIQPLAAIAEIDPFDWQRAIFTNLNAPVFLTQQLLARMQGARVLFMTSEPDISAVEGAAAYCVSKQALQMAVECFQAEIGAETAQFCSVSPGLVDTPMQAQIRSTRREVLPAVEYLLQFHAEGRLLPTEVVAKFICWILLEVESSKFAESTWDIYDESHHKLWMKKT